MLYFYGSYGDSTKDRYNILFLNINMDVIYYIQIYSWIYKLQSEINLKLVEVNITCYIQTYIWM